MIDYAYIFGHPKEYWGLYLVLAVFLLINGALVWIGGLSVYGSWAAPRRRYLRRLLFAVIPLALGGWGAWKQCPLTLEENGVTAVFDLCRWFFVPCGVGMLALAAWLFTVVMVRTSHKTQNNADEITSL